MKDKLARLVCALLLIFAFGFGLVMAGDPVGWTTKAYSAEAASYTVKPGDTLSELTYDFQGDGGPRKWQEVIKVNPFLKEPGRVFERGGRTIVLIRPGEKLAGLERLGVETKAIPLSELKVTGELKAAEKPEPATKDRKLETLLAVLVFLLLIPFLFWHRFRRPASQAGPPVVPGGITSPEDADRMLQAISQRRWGRINPTANLATEPGPTRISPVVKGFLNGRGRVQYNAEETPVRLMRNEPAYSARFRFPDGKEEELYFLQECGNEVRRGVRFLGFTFTPERVEEPVAAQTQAPAETVSQSAQPMATVFIDDGRKICFPVSHSVVIIGDEVRILSPEAMGQMAQN